VNSRQCEVISSELAERIWSGLNLALCKISVLDFC